MVRGGTAAIVLGGLLVFSGFVGVDAAAAGRAAAGSAVPEAPVPGYTPNFVTQTDERPPWNDCLWASGAMLLDKWTNGRVQPDRERLRRASGDTSGGSRFSDLARAISRAYGWRPAYSPDGGDPLSWSGLLDRLAAGGGAVIAGDYGQLGFPYTRWDRSYAADPHAPGHAVYVERYDAAHGRMWLMDPLGRGAYDGEWVPVGRVRNFIWHRRGWVSAMATPAPPARSATGWVPGAFALAADSHRAGDVVPATLPLVARGPWPLPNLSLQASWQLITPDPQLTAKTAVTAIAGAPVAAPSPFTMFSQLPSSTDAAPSAVGPTATALLTEVALPSQPGLWRLSPLVKRGDGKSLPPAWALAAVEVRVWGDRGAVVIPVPPTAAAAGQPLQASVTVEDAGKLAWTLAGAGPQLGEDALSTTTELEAAWIGLDGQRHDALGPLVLVATSGQQEQLNITLLAPPLPGDYELQFDVRDGQGSLLAADDVTATIAVPVGPAPVPTVEPTQNQ